MAEATFFGVPEEFIRTVKDLPVLLPVAGFELSFDSLFSDFTDGAGGGIGFTETGLFVVAGRGHEGEFRGVRTPLDVGPFSATAGDVITQCGAVLVKSDMVTFSSPGRGYFQASSLGWPTEVLTKYMSPVWRWSC